MPTRGDSRTRTIRFENDELDRWIAIAERQGKSFNRWCREACAAAAAGEELRLLTPSHMTGAKPGPVRSGSRAQGVKADIVFPNEMCERAGCPNDRIPGTSYCMQHKGMEGADCL